MRKYFLIALGGLLATGSIAPDLSVGLKTPPIPPAAPYERQELHVLKRVPSAEDSLPVDAYREARAHVKQMPAYSSVLKRSVDPQQKSSETYWESLGPDNVGGRTRALVISPEGQMYAAGVSGGVWKAQGSGQQMSWEPLGEGMENLNIGTLALDPTNSSTIYAGTGEVFRHTNRPYSSMTGAGIFKSIDAGDSWEQLAETVNENFLYVSDIVVSAANSERLYAATNTGVWRSLDGGATFQQILNPVNAQQQRLYEGCIDLQLVPDQGEDWLLVSCASRSTDDRYFLPGLLPDACDGPCRARVYLNQNAASSNAWEVVLSEPGMGRTSIALHKSDPSILYALSASTRPGFDRNLDRRGDYQNGLHAVFKSVDAGQSWVATVRNDDPDGLSTYLLAYASDFYCESRDPYSAGWYNQAIAVDPDDPDIVWVGGMQLYRSDDGGETFGLASHWYTNAPGNYWMHADIHTLLIPDQPGANNRLWIGNDGGVWVSDNATAPVWRDPLETCNPRAGSLNYAQRNIGYTTSQFYHGVVYPDGETFVAGAQDNGTQWTQSGNNNWTHILGGDGSTSAISADQEYLYISYQNGNIARVDSQFNGVWVHGVNSAFPGTPRSQDAYLFITPFVTDYNQPDWLYLGGTRLWRSKDDGESWEKASRTAGPGNFDFYSRITSMAVSDVDSSVVLVGNGHGIFRNRFADVSDEFFDMPEASPREGWVSSLAFEPGSSEVAYATYSTFGGDHVWKTTDGGSSWEPLTGSGNGQLPDLPVHSIVINPDDVAQLYIGTDLGIFVSLDGGQSWSREIAGFGQPIVERLAINRPTDGGQRYLVAFTYGRGVWRTALENVQPQGYQADAEVSGGWLDDDSNQVQLQVRPGVDEPQLLLLWKTFANGQNYWLKGAGPLSGGIAQLSVERMTNTNWAPNVDAQAAIWIAVGQIEVEFMDVDQAEMRWQLDGDVSGQSALTREYSVMGLPPRNRADICRSGLWEPRPRPGTDFFILHTTQKDDHGHLYFSWAGSHQGEAFWLSGDAPFTGPIVKPQVSILSGGQFPPKFDGADVQSEAFGQIKFKFLENAYIQVKSRPDHPDFEKASFVLKQASGLNLAECL